VCGVFLPRRVMPFLHHKNANIVAGRISWQYGKRRGEWANITAKGQPQGIAPTSLVIFALFILINL